MLIPSHFVPTDPVNLGLISFGAGPRVKHIYSGGSSHRNSLDIVDPNNKELLEEWLIFHSFIIQSRIPLDFYINEDFPEKLEILNHPSQFPRDYSELALEVYWQQPDRAKKLKDKSYNGIYKIYRALPPEVKNLVNSFLVDLSAVSGRKNRQVANRTYWQIVNYYSIIDAIIGEPPYCKDSFDCEHCNRCSLTHHKISAKEWLESELSKLMVDSEWLPTYLDIILTARNKIRHKTVHSAILPTAIYPSHLANESVQYDTKKAITEFKTDVHALKALKGMLESVTWNILMNHLFAHGIFQRPTGYSVSYMNLSFEKS